MRTALWVRDSEQERRFDSHKAACSMRIIDLFGGEGAVVLEERLLIRVFLEIVVGVQFDPYSIFWLDVYDE